MQNILLPTADVLAGTCTSSNCSLAFLHDHTASQNNFLICHPVLIKSDSHLKDRKSPTQNKKKKKEDFLPFLWLERNTLAKYESAHW